ncbi:MAG: hypothetical protein ACAH83_17365 [Alphaproteobacteria bacterium]
MNISPKTLFLMVAVLVLLAWASYRAGRESEPAAVPQTQTSSGSSAPDMNAGAEALTNANDRLVVSGLTILHMQKYMLDLCGITVADAPATFAKLKADEENFHASMSAAAKSALPAEYAKIESKLKPEWDRSTPEQRAAGCKDIKAQAVEGAP